MIKAGYWRTRLWPNRRWREIEHSVDNAVGAENPGVVVVGILLEVLSIAAVIEQQVNRRG